MAIEFRMLVRGDYTDHQNLMSMAFGRGGIRQPLAEDAPDPVGLLNTIGLFEDGKLMSSVGVEPYRVHFGYGTQLGYGGIGGVACANERRGRGYVQQLLIRSLALMEERGQTISGLYPFAYAFYRKFGWEYVGHVQNIKLPVRELKRYNPAGWDVSEIDLEANLELIKPFYDTVAANYRSAFTASTHKWHDDYKAHDNRKSFVYVARDQHGEVGGLMRFRYPAHGSDDLPSVSRLWSNCPAALHSLLDVIRDIGVQHDTVQLQVPADFPTLSINCSHGTKIALEPVYQGRIVSIAQWAAGISLPITTSENTLTVRLDDPHCPWNDGTWKLTRTHTGVSAEKGDTASSADIEIDITTFSQLAFGEPSRIPLQAAGKLPFVSADINAAIDAIFPPHAVYLWDGF
jgi:predicted acetyltransferase